MAEVVFYTSGSTGEPKRIAREDAALKADAENLVRTFPFLSDGAPIFLESIRSEHFFGALWRDRVPVVAGGIVDPAVIISVEELIAKTANGRPSILVTTPSFLEKALGNPDFVQLKGRFKGIVTSGSALRLETALRITELIGICPTEIYGSTEAGSIAWRRQSESELAHLFAGVEGEADSEGRLIVRSALAMENPLVMGDLVKFKTARDFELLGRADRLVKVLEKYVSLTAVERALTAHQYIASARAETFGDGVQRIGAVCVLSSSGAEALAKTTYTEFLSQLRGDLIKSDTTLPSAAFPRRFRMVRELPTDARGKTPSALMREILNSSLREPVVMNWSATANSLSAELVFPPDNECFKGHFPGFPVLPGVAQLFFIRHFARQVFADFPDACTYRKLKFRRLVRPLDRLALMVKRKGEGNFEFELSCEGEGVASGSMEGWTT